MKARMLVTIASLLNFACERELDEERFVGNFVRMSTPSEQLEFVGIDTVYSKCSQTSDWGLTYETYVFDGDGKFESFFIQLYKEEYDNSEFVCSFDYNSSDNYRLSWRSSYSDSTIIIYNLWPENRNLIVSIDKKEGKHYLIGDFSGLLISYQPFDPYKNTPELEPFDTLQIIKGRFFFEVGRVNKVD